MKNVIVASNNPVKIQAVSGGFLRMFPDIQFKFESLALPSGVPAQPLSDAETLKGAQTRARNAKKYRPQADFWAGIEGGVDASGANLTAFAWVVILNGQNAGQSRTGAFYLPPAVAELVRSGIELGEADDRVFGRQDSKRQEGAIGLLTGGVVDRRALYEQAVILALLPFRNPGLYPPNSITPPGD